jgi:hypothetical protein
MINAVVIIDAVVDVTSSASSRTTIVTTPELFLERHT